ncbi:unnamed protein product [Didymodactylos carnosus]|uniref:NFX1-type zinc finger-containing protein 1 n=1 Tax=Didymodactylos carnosus TaxID=1234261 RepID=A0A8S2E1V1_9BILA|nr:unnamed protein product [Didymodactylos carnosus]CAF3861194.1 unnamed protein product [Didymodactylos carnosus]
MKAVGKGLNLCCICPSKKPFVVSTPESFSKLPNGGCQKHCESRLLCGHQCVLSGTCDLCQHGQLHLQCQETYEKTSICGHVYSGLCRETCLPCMLPCENRCPHSRCTRLCSEVCNTCKEVCTWSCEHQKCTKLCSEPCDRKPCKNICQKLLKCNHQHEIKVKKIQVNVGSEQKTILNELKILTSKYRPFIMKNCQRFDMLYEQIKNVLNLSELCTTKDQQIQIVSETDGHKLFLCSNGHPYMRYSETDQSSHCHECTLQTGESTH